eukprot:TRINITY_DN17154_c0_g1_i2.p1 TRINITY_DN17154_c0_g1~~TRINITY_DN17154_c0_g1_i2.p1  ORF type:complete len:515 (-),score=114.39 TRINITY_DN17154_c0_g1_i2:96-1640(-)
MVFTGTVEDIGVVEKVRREACSELWDGTHGKGFELRISCTTALKDAHVGCSISVNGVSLTATVVDGEAFEVKCSPETLRRTDLGDLEAGSLVNLERSMAASARIFGHVVQGSVDETGTILEKRPEGDALWIKVSLSQNIIPFVVPKGRIAMDGASLTVVDVNHKERWFKVLLTPHTQKRIVLPTKKVGAKVNLEADAMGKYAFSAFRMVDTQLKDLEDTLAKMQVQSGAKQNDLDVVQGSIGKIRSELPNLGAPTDDEAGTLLNISSTSVGLCDRLAQDVAREPLAARLPIDGLESLKVTTLEDAASKLEGELEKAIEFARACKMLVQERKAANEIPQEFDDENAGAIAYYTASWSTPSKSFYSKINSLLRAADRSGLTKYMRMLKLISAGLLDLPRFEGNVWRGVKEDLHEKYVKGTSVTWWAFASTATSTTALEDEQYLGKTGKRTLFSIWTRHGFSIRAFSFFQKEDEVLLPPGLSFHVSDVVDFGNELHMVVLREIASPFCILNSLSSKL